MKGALLLLLWEAGATVWWTLGQPRRVAAPSLRGYESVVIDRVAISLVDACSRQYLCNAQGFICWSMFV
jgi:hypothetical protein